MSIDTTEASRMFFRDWSKREALAFFLTVSIVYVFPLILADYPYVDHIYRAVDGDVDWIKEGRFLMPFFYNFLSFTRGIPDSFPLALLIATAIMAFALQSLMLHYFQRANFFCAVVVLPLFFNPFFLSNLTYHYDGPVATLGIAALIFSVTFNSPYRWVNWTVPALLVWIALAIYQPLMNVFFALCAIELYKGLVNRKTLSELGLFVFVKCAQVVVALVVYMGVVSPFLSRSRQGVVAFDSSWISRVLTRFQHIEASLSSLYTGDSQWFFILMMVLAGMGYIGGGLSVLKYRDGVGVKGLVGGIYLSVPLLLVTCIPGVMVLFSFEQSDSRLMLAVGPLFTFILLLVYWLLRKLPRYFMWVLVLPLIFAMNFSYSYGRVLSAKKELDISLVNSVVASINAHAQLKNIKSFYFSIDESELWLPAAQGALSVTPVMSYVLSANFLLLPYSMIRAGIPNVGWQDKTHPVAAIVQSDISPVVDTRFYSIYVFHDDGYIVMKHMPPSGS
ncbi:glucosyltransferase domain-containing protein [Pseudomonas capeferrum]